MIAVVLQARTPCHNRTLRLPVTPHVPHERYERTCAACGFAWSIDRVTMRTGDVRMDRVTWTAASRLGIPERDS